MAMQQLCLTQTFASGLGPRRSCCMAIRGQVKQPTMLLSRDTCAEEMQLTYGRIALH